MDEETTRVVEGDSRVISPNLPEGMMAPWPKGQSGNPKGRPPEAERLISKLLRKHPDALDRAAEALSRVLGDETSRHWLGAVKEVQDRTEGPVASQTHHHVSTDRAIVTHAPTGPAPELPGLPEGEPPQVE